MATDFHELEEELWRALRSRRFNDFQQFLAPGFLSVDDDELASGTELIRAFNEMALEDYDLSQMVTTQPANNVAVVTYHVWERVRRGAEPTERKTIAASIWIRKNDFWLLELHYETSTDR
ncbi:MAG TPA: nuclear transport factor 2 family protein [Acidimicrobiales bacterium]|nr:nuclear transport factor 2 family protein [Acidimicrobiales bacterium]